MKQIFLALILISNYCYAQLGMYETAAKHGKDALYKDYRTLNDNNNDGLFEDISDSEYSYTIVTSLKDDKFKIGFDIKTTENKHRGITIDIEKRPHIMYGYPQTYLIYNRRDKEGYVFIDDYFFVLKKFNTEDFSYGSIGKVFIREGSAKDAKAEGTETGKKKGLKGLMGKISAKMSNPDVAKLKGIKINEMIANYLTEMKKKDEAHKKTAEEESELAHLMGLKAAHDQYIRDYNDAYKRKPEYQKMLQGRAYGQAADDRKMLKIGEEKVKECLYTIINKRSTDVNYVFSTGELHTIKPGEKETLWCYHIAFWAEGKDKGLPIAGGKYSLGGVVITLEDE